MAKLEPPTDAFATTWLPPVWSHLASAGAGPERYAAVVKPPGRGGFWILKVTQGPFPESAARFDFGQVGAPRPLGDVASFGDDTPIGIRTPGARALRARPARSLRAACRSRRSRPTRAAPPVARLMMLRAAVLALSSPPRGQTGARRRCPCIFGPTASDRRHLGATHRRW